LELWLNKSFIREAHQKCICNQKLINNKQTFQENTSDAGNEYSSIIYCHGKQHKNIFILFRINRNCV